MKPIKFMFSKRNRFMIQIVSYLFVLLIPTLVSIIIYYESNYAIKSEIKKSNSISMSNIKKTFDSEINNVKNLVVEAYMFPQFDKLAKIENSGQTIDRTVTADYIQNLRQVSLISNLVDDIYICFDKSGLVVTTGGVVDMQTSYNTIHQQSSISYD